MILDAKMAWRNVWRNPRRSILTVAAVAFACVLLVFMLSFQFGSYDAMINAAVKVHTGHMQIQVPGYQDNHRIRLAIDHPERIEKALTHLPGIEAVTSRANAFAMVSSGTRTYGVQVIGIDPARERRVSTLPSLIRKGACLAETDRDVALVGQKLADNLKVGIGDEITLLGQGRDGSVAAAVFKIKGIYKSGLDAFDRSSIQVPLATFQDVFFMGDRVHEIVITIPTLNELARVKARVAALLKTAPTDQSLVVLDWKDLMPGLSQGISMDLVSGLIMYFILILVVAFSILNTFLMSILERTREFGVMMAIGTTPWRLVRLVMLESTFLTFVGVASGILLGCAITAWFQVHGIDISGASEIFQEYGISGSLHPLLSLKSILIGPAMVLVVTFPAAFVPAMKIRALRPIEAIAAI
jgi:putative ABC transport system permease protein